MNASIDEKLIHTTIRIISIRNDDLTSTGTGFFFRFDLKGKNIPVIVTNKYVVEKLKKLF